MDPTTSPTGSRVRRAYRLRIVALLCAVSIASCTGGDPDEGPPGEPSPNDARSASFTVGVLGEPATLDPYSERAGDLTFALARPLYPSLFRLLPDGSVEPYLADDLVSTPDGVRVRLRRAVWSNGRRIDARDVVLSARRARPPSGFAGIAGVRATGMSEIEFTGSVQDWRTALASGAPVLPRGRVRPGVYGGPFLLDRYRAGHQVIFERNERWDHADVLPQRVRVQFVEDTGTLHSLAQTGHFDVIAPPSNVNLSERLEALGLEVFDLSGWEGIRLEFRRGFDRRLAARLGGSIDRGLLAHSFLRTEGRVSDALSPGPMEADGAEPEVEGGQVDLEGPLSLAVPAGDELLGLLQRAIEVQWSRHDPIDLVSADTRTFYGRWRTAPEVDARLVRFSGGPGTTPPNGGPTVPLFQVHSFLAGGEHVRGLEPSGSIEGPLWNLEAWRKVGPGE